MRFHAWRDDEGCSDCLSLNVSFALAGFDVFLQFPAATQTASPARCNAAPSQCFTAGTPAVSGAGLMPSLMCIYILVSMSAWMVVMEISASVNTVPTVCGSDACPPEALPVSPSSGDTRLSEAADCKRKRAGRRSGRRFGGRDLDRVRDQLGDDHPDHCPRGGPEPDGQQPLEPFDKHVRRHRDDLRAPSPSSRAGPRGPGGENKNGSSGRTEMAPAAAGARTGWPSDEMIAQAAARQRLSPRGTATSATASPAAHL